MVTPHRIHHDLYGGSKDLEDPGDGGTIRIAEDLQMCEMVASASNETRTLTVPDKPGIRFTLRLLTAGGGSVLVTCAEGLNVRLTPEATFTEASDFLSLISVSTATGYRWEIIEGNAGVTLV